MKTNRQGLGLVRLRLTNTNFGQIFSLPYDVKQKLGFLSSSNMTPEQFIKLNSIELIDEE